MADQDALQIEKLQLEVLRIPLEMRKLEADLAKGPDERDKLEAELEKVRREHQKLELDVADVGWKVRTQKPGLFLEIAKVLLMVLAVLVPATIGLVTLLAQVSQFLEQQASSLRQKTREEVFATAKDLRDTEKAEDLGLRIMAARRLGSVGLPGLPFLLDQLAEERGDNRLYVALLNSVQDVVEQASAPPGRTGSTSELLSRPLGVVASLFGVADRAPEPPLRSERTRIFSALVHFKRHLLSDVKKPDPTESLLRAYVTALSALGRAGTHALGDAKEVAMNRADVIRIMDELQAAIDRNRHRPAQQGLKDVRALIDRERSGIGAR